MINMSEKMKVMLATEGTYPFHQGGVSTWCDFLVNNLREIDYVIYSIIMNPYVTQKFTLPPGSRLIKVPLWGTEEPSEHLDIPFARVFLSKKRTVERIIRTEFLPLFKDLIDEIVSPERDNKKFGQILFELQRYFEEYEYKESFKSEITWEFYKDNMLKAAAIERNKIPRPGVYSLIQSLGWVYRFFTILNTPIPRVDVSHSAAAAFCSIPCVLAKLKNNTPFLLTEHGVYLREQYLSLSQRGYSPFLNDFLIKLVSSVVGLSYTYASQVSPVCNYNTRWERELGVDPKKIEVIYNGVDEKVMKQKIRQKNSSRTIVVSSVARIDPIKDQLTLIKAAKVVIDRYPNVQFVVYGSTSVPEYYEECKNLIRALKLEDKFILAGHTNDTPSVYSNGDIIALSSVSEAFPYSVVEAMMVGKPIVSTDVGGISEAIGECGILVPPRNHEKMARGIITLIENPELAANLAAEARDRALNYFTVDGVKKHYLNTYYRLKRSQEAGDTKIVPFRLKKQKLYAEKAYALKELGYLEEAIDQLRKAVREAPESPAVPVLLTQIADIYNHLGKFDKAICELEKAQALAKLLEKENIA